MKTPRVRDFDPNAKVPILKSSMDNMPAIGRTKTNPPATLPAQTQDAIQKLPSNKYPELVRANEKKDVITHTSPTTDPTKRKYIKRTFDLFEDQLSYLTKESLQDRLAGKEVSMNSMVREAIDEWIKRRKARN